MTIKLHDPNKITRDSDPVLLYRVSPYGVSILKSAAQKFTNFFNIPRLLFQNLGCLRQRETSKGGLSQLIKMTVKESLPDAGNKEYV